MQNAKCKMQNMVIFRQGKKFPIKIFRVAEIIIRRSRSSFRASGSSFAAGDHHSAPADHHSRIARQYT